MMTALQGAFAALREKDPHHQAKAAAILWKLQQEMAAGGDEEALQQQVKAALSEALKRLVAPSAVPPDNGQGAALLERALAGEKSLVLQAILAKVKAKAPVEEVAAVVATAMRANKAFQAEVASVGGNLAALAQQHLGEWVDDHPNNLTYLEGLAIAVNRLLDAEPVQEEQATHAHKDLGFAKLTAHADGSLVLDLLHKSEGLHLLTSEQATALREALEQASEAARLSNPGAQEASPQ